MQVNIIYLINIKYNNKSGNKKYDLYRCIWYTLTVQISDKNNKNQKSSRHLHVVTK